MIVYFRPISSRDPITDQITGVGRCGHSTEPVKLSWIGSGEISRQFADSEILGKFRTSRSTENGRFLCPVESADVITVLGPIGSRQQNSFTNMSFAYIENRQVWRNRKTLACRSSTAGIIVEVSAAVLAPVVAISIHVITVVVVGRHVVDRCIRVVAVICTWSRYRLTPFQTHRAGFMTVS